jgi:phosphatidylserine/phosphatidylglycerophosphate/cardiolipin synthase-like enzyme
LAKFLDTTEISFRIERLLKTAGKRIILISPYLKLRARVRELIEDAARLGVRVHVVYGKKEMCDAAEQLRRTAGVKVTFCKNVHAKCYLNETVGIITSLNLYDFSEAKNQEMGVFFDRESDPGLYEDATKEAERIIRMSGGSTGHQESSVAAVTAKVAETARDYNKLTTAKLAAKLGVQTTQLFNKLIGRGYLELRDGGKHYITHQGRQVGGEFRMGKGPYFLWPPDLRV